MHVGGPCSIQGQVALRQIFFVCLQFLFDVTSCAVDHGSPRKNRVKGFLAERKCPASFEDPVHQDLKGIRNDIVMIIMVEIILIV